MKRAIELSWVWAIALLLGGALVVAGCDSNNDDDDEDTSTEDTAADFEEDTATDPIPEPTTEPPLDTTVTDSPEDTAIDWEYDGDTGFVGDPCATNDDCPGVPSAAVNCLTDIMGYVSLPNGYCSADCTSDAECGEGAECLDVMGFFAACLKMCTDNSDCREAEGYECAEIPYIGGGPYCLPIFEMPDMPTDGSADVTPDPVTDVGDDAASDVPAD